MMLNRSFRIPAGLAVLSLTGCPTSIPEPATEPATEPVPFSFIGVWDVNRFAFTYDGDSGSVDYPYTYDTETTALEMAFTDTSMSITNVYTYSDSTPPSSYTQGPYSWNEESAGRIQVTGIEDVMSLYCDEVNENEITCDITYAADDTGILFATRRL